MSATAYNETLTGSDGYTLTDSDNLNTGNFNHSLVGSGSNTKINGTTTTGSDSYTQSQTGDGTDAGITLSQTGTTRYGNLAQYNDPSDAGSGLSGIAGSSAIGPMVQIMGTFSGATGSPQAVGDAAFKYCFARGTLVLLADGTSKAIEKLEVGQMVMASPESDPEAKPTACKVLQVFHNPPARIFDVEVNDEIIRTTAGHPFYIRGKGWVKVKDLQINDELTTSDGVFLKVQRIVDSGRTEAVFNLEVRDNHTYFLRLPQSEKSVLVHNASPDLNPDDYTLSIATQPATQPASTTQAAPTTQPADQIPISVMISSTTTQGPKSDDSMFSTTIIFGEQAPGKSWLGIKIGSTYDVFKNSSSESVTVTAAQHVTDDFSIGGILGYNTTGNAPTVGLEGLFNIKNVQFDVTAQDAYALGSGENTVQTMIKATTPVPPLPSQPGSPPPAPQPSLILMAMTTIDFTTLAQKYQLTLGPNVPIGDMLVNPYVGLYDNIDPDSMGDIYGINVTINGNSKLPKWLKNFTFGAARQGKNDIFTLSGTFAF